MIDIQLLHHPPPPQAPHLVTSDFIVILFVANCMALHAPSKHVTSNVMRDYAIHGGIKPRNVYRDCLNLLRYTRVSGSCSCTLLLYTALVPCSGTLCCVLDLCYGPYSVCSLNGICVSCTETQMQIRMAIVHCITGSSL